MTTPRHRQDGETPMATPHVDTAVVLVLELDGKGRAALSEFLESYRPLARYWVDDPEGVEDVLAITTGWTRNT